MYYIKYFIRITLIIVFAYCLNGCKKFVDIEPSPNLILSEKLFENETTALSAVNGVYLQMRVPSPALANGTLSIYAGLGSDELTTSSTTLEFDAFYKNSILATSTVVNTQIWSSAYKVIYRTNSIIENLAKSNALSPSTKNQLTGEMKVVRALYYFYLVNLFGEVPLITSTDYQANSVISRRPVTQVYDQVISDLKDARTLLSTTYPSSGKVRPNKWSAIALLSRVYLFRENWAEAENEASSIISSNDYSLANISATNAFAKNSTETIWELASQNESRNTVEGSQFIPSSSSSRPTFPLSSYLLNAFETGDLRKVTTGTNGWLGKNTVSGVDYYFPRKYKARTASPVSEYEIVFRLAEQYLIRAEARVQQGKVVEAIADLNVIRNRAGLLNTTATNQISVLSAIQQERRVELFAEWGNRWFDLKRYGLATTILAPLKGSNWQETDILLPIPFTEIQINTSLVQNPGY